jgi:hypothetical protein
MGKGSGAEGGTGESLVFIRDPEYAWIPAIKTGGDAKTAQVRVPQYPDEQSIICDGGASAKKMEDEEVSLKDYHRGVLPMQNVKGGALSCFEDMVNLPFLHEVSTPQVAPALAPIPEAHQGSKDNELQNRTALVFLRHEKPLLTCVTVVYYHYYYL